MKPLLIAILPAASFAMIGLLAAWGIAVYAPTRPTQRPRLRTHDVYRPATLWRGDQLVSIGFLATPLHSE